MSTSAPRRFDDFPLPTPLLRALADVGYESPSPIQASALPPLLEGRDVLGHAPTGTGKTAAFALPLLARIDPANKAVQALVLTPTRELAIQVAEAMTRYSAHMPKTRVLAVYGGQDYQHQLRGLKGGTAIVVGTPGRVMDHIRRGSLSLKTLDMLVLDEADEMLRMGFVDDVEWILEQTPSSRQIALFSATMPKPIRRIAERHLNEPVNIAIEREPQRALSIRQHYWTVSAPQKFAALSRILECEPHERVMVFVRTRLATNDIAERLQARGFSAAALNGDLAQKQRERIVERFRRGQLDMLIATDVAARGLDVDGISHVINYDMPHDVEAYVHRIGRTGRAGKQGDAILFVTPREQRLLRNFERATAGRIAAYEMPSIETVNQRRLQQLGERVEALLQSSNPNDQAALDRLEDWLVARAHEQGIGTSRLGAAFAQLSCGDNPLFAETARNKTSKKKEQGFSDKRRDSAHGDTRQKPHSHNHDSAGKTHSRHDQTRQSARTHKSDVVWQQYRVEVGSDHGVEARNLVGAIANEADLDRQYIGRIRILPEFSVVELPDGMPKAILKDLRRVWVCNRKLAMSLMDEGPSAGRPSNHKHKERNNGKARQQAKAHKPRKARKKAKA